MTSFYDDIADRYDEITGAGGRLEPAAAFVKELVSRHSVRSAVDAACGSGLYALLLAEAGARAIGVDISAGMLAEARRLSGRAGRDVEWVQASMQELAEKVPGSQDAVLCMGNSLPHLLTDADLAAALESFRRVLRPGGVLAIQVLNYSRILARKERIVGTDRHGERLYVRFYDFLGDLVRFNILAIDLSTLRSSPLRRHSYGASATATEDGSVEPPAHALHSTTLRPYTRDALAAALERQGFADVQASGDLKLGRFDRAASDMLVILAGAPS